MIGAGFKRLLDILASAIIFIISTPLITLVSLIILLTMGKPIFFRQRRPGRDGKLFDIIKFRTMLAADEESGKVSDESRLTATGRWIRRLSLDELPQLLNILQGHMSLVGPRPLLPEYLPLYTPEQNRRHLVKPGITGWAQIHGRNATTWEERLAYDVWYVDHWSFWLDLKILAITAVKVLKGEGISAEGHATMPRFEGTKTGGQQDRG